MIIVTVVFYGNFLPGKIDIDFTPIKQISIFNRIGILGKIIV